MVRKDTMNSGNKFLNGTGQMLYKKAKKLIPGGTQLLSKRPEMFAPDVWPSYYSRAKGVDIWDMDNNRYTDMSIMGIGANILGYSDDDVDNAVIQSVKDGTSSTLNCPEEVELAELLTNLHPWSDMVRYARSGGEACAISVRIARAHTKKDKVFFSGYHGWSDWYLSSNLGETDALDGQLMPGLEPRGVPRSLKDTAIPFHFNNIDELKLKTQGIENEIAAIIVEPARGEDAPKHYLIELKNFAKKINAVLIFDEITSGFRMCNGGLHLKYGVNPDMAIFAKSLGNGYAISAIIGTEKVMSNVQSTFISSTNWTERIGPTAAIATIRKYEEKMAHNHLIRMGNGVKKIWKSTSEKYGIPINISGLPTLGSFSFNDKNNQAMMTFFTIEMLKRGFLAYRQFKASYSHSEKNLIDYQTAVDEVFSLLAKDNWASFLKTPIAHTGFVRLTKE